jgi:flagellar hook assembly protein FlgD
MGHGRLRWGLVAGTVLVASFGLTAPASADPGTVPVITAPPTGNVSGDVEITVASAAASVQFFLDGFGYGPQVAVSGGTASAQWPTWSRPDGAHSWTAADCDAVSCNATQSAPLALTIANTPPTITAPTDGATVAGNVTVTAATAAPQVQFYLDSVAFGSPVTVTAGSASVQWATGSLADGAHSWAAADCDINGCNAARSTAVGVTIDNPPTITAPTNGATVTGVVTVTATAAAPQVQFYLDSVAFGSPVTVTAGSASVQWTTWSLADGAHSWAAADCDIGCSAARSTAVGVTIDNLAPTITAPTDGATVAGNVTVTAATAAPLVQFYLADVAFGTPVTVSGGSASVQWPTFGIANGSYEWTAAACDANGCSAELSTVNVTLANGAPAVTSPSNGDVSNAIVTIEATSPGGGLAFFLDGTQVSFDATAPYAFTMSTPLSQGGHTASVKQCDTAGTACNGPSSSTITFTVGKLSPSITSVTPNPFSPTSSATGRTSFRVHLPEPQSVTFRVRNANGQTVAGPHSPGLETAGNHTYRWNGRDNSGKVVADGIYTIVVNTTTGSGPTLLQGGDTATVRVDHTGTSFTALTGVGSTTFPVRDGYRDRFRPTVRVNEGGRLRLVIFTPHGSRLRVISKPHASKGTFEFEWNGRNAKNQLVPPGTYGFQFNAEDQAGNRNSSRRFAVRVSHRRTVRKTVTVLRPGDVGNVGATNARCTQYSFGFSNFAHGLWLDNFCDRGFDDAVIYADYTFAVPGAVHYDDIRVRTVGATYSPGPISVQVYNFTDSKWEAAGSTTLRTKSKVVSSTFRAVSGAHRVSLRHRVRIRVLVPNLRRQEDYDIARAGIVVSYRVLS